MPSRNTNKVSNILNPDQGLCSVSSDLDPNCLQRLSAVNDFDPHQDQCYVGSDLDPNCLQRLSADK